LRDVNWLRIRSSCGDSDAPYRTITMGKLQMFGKVLKDCLALGN